jgi:hypothetical protein
MTQVSTPQATTQTLDGGIQRGPQPTLDAVLAQTATVNAAVAQIPPEPEEPEEEEQEEKQEQADDKQFELLLRKAERAFVKGNKGLLFGRIECGKYCHECYVLREKEGHKNRGFTSMIILNRLAVHADSKADCDANVLAQMYQAVQILCPEERWKAMAKLPIHPLTVGKMEDLAKLVKRVDGTELYTVFDPARLEEAKALFQWACGDGINKPARKDIDAKVQEMKDPEKYAQKLEEKRKAEAEKAKAKAQGDEVDEDDEEEQEETAPPKNLIATQPDKSRPAPDWKDVGEGMGSLLNEGRKQEPAKVGEIRNQFLQQITTLTVKDSAEWMLGFFHEACKRHPGKSHEVVREFAKLIAWTAPTIKGLVAGIGDTKDSEEMLQVLVDTVEAEYSIVADELQEAA